MELLTKIKKPARIGRNEAGTAFLVVDKSDIGKTGEDVMGRVEYTNGRISGERPLQQFYKFGVWFPVEPSK
jgi:hypothetical protein